jgi:hypothetical protein
MMRVESCEVALMKKTCRNATLKDSPMVYANSRDSDFGPCPLVQVNERDDICVA